MTVTQFRRLFSRPGPNQRLAVCEVCGQRLYGLGWLRHELYSRWRHRHAVGWDLYLAQVYHWLDDRARILLLRQPPRQNKHDWLTCWLYRKVMLGQY